MTGTRALFASIGASVLLVAAAALSLLAVSAVFAFGGWSDPVADSGRQTALVLAADDADTRQGSRQKAFVLPSRTPAERSARPATRTGPVPQRTARAADQAAITPETNRRPQAAFSPPPPVSAPETVTPQAPAAPKKSAGDGVRTAGDDISGKVENTGDALAQLTDPLLPPVTAATQKVLNLVADLLRRTTDNLGSTVDRVLPVQ